MNRDAHPAAVRAPRLRQLQLPAQVLRRRDREGDHARLQRVELARQRAELVVRAELGQERSGIIAGRLDVLHTVRVGDTVGAPTDGVGASSAPAKRVSSLFAHTEPLGFGRRPRESRRFRRESRLDPLPFLVRALERFAVLVHGGQFSVAVVVVVVGVDAVVGVGPEPTLAALPRRVQVLVVVGAHVVVEAVVVEHQRQRALVHPIVVQHVQLVHRIDVHFDGVRSVETLEETGGRAGRSSGRRIEVERRFHPGKLARVPSLRLGCLGRFVSRLPLGYLGRFDLQL